MTLGVVIEETPSWFRSAHCRDEDPDTFFPHDGTGVERARRICITCPVIDACLAYALERRIDFGVWGGTSEKERRKILGIKGRR